MLGRSRRELVQSHAGGIDRRHLPDSGAAASRVTQVWSRFDVKIRDAISMIEKDGRRFAAQKGSHRQFKHPVKPGRVTIAGALGDELAPGARADYISVSQ